MTAMHMDSLDVELVQQYLTAHPLPDVSTMLSWSPGSIQDQDWREFLKTDWEYKIKIFRQAIEPDQNLVIEGLPVVPLRKLFVKHEKQAIELESCEVVSLSDQELFAEYVTMKCMNCGTRRTIRKDEVTQDTKKSCDKMTCSKPNLVEVTNLRQDAIDSQYIKLREQQYDGSEMPMTINGLLKGESMIWSVKFNERVKVQALLRYRKIQNPRTKETEYHSWLDIFGVKRVDPDQDNPLTDQDKEYIRSEQAKPDFYNKLIRSFCPAIWGMHTFKEAILLALASIRLPRPARILIVTDPGMGKSKMVKIMKLYYPSAIITQMGRSTGTGLTVSSEMDEETGRSHIGRGALVQGDKGIVIIDEAQFGDPKTFMMLNDVMESGQVKYAFRGGNVGHVDANAAIVMLSNPHEGRFGSEEALGNILKFMGNALPQQMSRLQYVLLRRDQLTTEERRKIASHMAMHNENNPAYMAQYYDNWYDSEELEVYEFKLAEGLTVNIQLPVERFGTKWIKKILRYVINEVQVSEMPQEHMRTLVDYYMKNRTHTDTNINKMLTNRFMEHGQNLAIYMARIKGKSSPGEEEIFHTMELLEKSMDVNAFDPKTKTYDYNMFNNIRPEKEIEKMAKDTQFEEAIESAMIEQKEDGTVKEKGYFTINDIEFACQMLPNSKWKNIVDIQKEIDKRLRFGKLYEKHGAGKYTPI